MSCHVSILVLVVRFFFFQAEDGIRDLVRSRGLGDVYKRQSPACTYCRQMESEVIPQDAVRAEIGEFVPVKIDACLLYTSDAADERSSVDLGGRRIIKKKNDQRDHLVCS